MQYSSTASRTPLRGRFTGKTRPNDIYYAIAGGMEVPFLRAGFRMVVFSVIIMVVVLFFRRGLFGDRELPYIVRRLGLYIRKVVKYREAATKKAAAEAKKEADGDE